MMVSIIVPVYNTGKYLRECIESVLRQSYQDWELLLMDDGSTDDSGKICDEYASSDSRIKVVHKRNSGVSDTRNKALDLAVGKYVIFLDSDDFWINNEILSIFVSKSEEEDLDIIRANYVEFNDKIGNVRSNVSDKQVSLSEKRLSYIQYMKFIVRRNYLTCVFMIKRTVIGALRFNINRVFMEDAEFYMKLFNNNLGCMYVNTDFYAYRKHESAVTVKYNPNKYFDAFNLSRLCYDLALQTKNNDIREFLLEEGALNYVDYIKVLARDNNKNVRSNCFLKKIRIQELRWKTIRMLLNSGQMYLILWVLLPIKVVRFLIKFRAYIARKITCQYK